MRVAEPNASVTDWVAVFGGALGALMATLDHTIMLESNQFSR